MTETRPLSIQHRDLPDRGAFFIASPDGTPIAEMVYARMAPDQINIEHTEVDASLRGQGIARQLLDTLVSWARQTGTRVQAKCSYARAQFLKDASIRDVYVR